MDTWVRLSSSQAAALDGCCSTSSHALAPPVSGFAEGIVRGHRTGLLTVADYNNLCQCENLDDIKLNLVGGRAWGCTPGPWAHLVPAALAWQLPDVAMRVHAACRRPPTTGHT